MNRQVISAVRAASGPVGRAFDWFDERTGARKFLDKALHEPIPGGARWAYVFGSGLLFIFALQVITGVSLALYYTPTAETAHTSVAYITKQVAGGAFLRSLHSYGSSAMIIVLGLHFLQTFLYGSFKGRRELLWLSGALLSLLILGMGFTGYLLPWDQKAYFATAVGTNVAGEVPVIGNLLTRLLRGGDSIGTLTLSRFYVAHVFLIPASIFAFIGAHVLLFRKAGPAGPINEHPVEPKLPTESFYPRQVLLDMGFALLIIAVLGGLSYLRPVTLGPIADPADSHFLPRPEWYYLPMFQWLKYWEGPWVVAGIVVIPGLLATAFFLMPFLDRRLERKPWRRPIPALAVAIVVAGMVYLGIKSQVDDHHGPVAAQLALQHDQEVAYTEAPFEPYVDEPEGGGRFTLLTSSVDPHIARGKAIFTQHGCVGCHGMSGQGTAIAPSLLGITHKLSQDQLIALLHSPNPRMRAAGMPAADLPPSDMTALLAYLDALGTRAANVPLMLGAAATSVPLREVAAGPVASIASTSDSGSLRGHNPSSLLAGKQLFQERACFACHGESGSGGRAPALASLISHLTDAQLNSALADPNPRMRAGGMPPVQGSAQELAALVVYLRSLRPAAQQLAPPESAGLASVQPETPRAEPAPPVTELPASTESLLPAEAVLSAVDPRPDAGRALFRSQGCVGCHGINAQGTQMAPSLHGVGGKYPGKLLQALLRQPTRKMRAGGMPTPALNDQQFENLVAYLKTLEDFPARTQTHQEVGANHSAPVQEPVSQAVPLAGPQENQTSSLQPDSNPQMDPSIRRGQLIFQRNACSTCHGENGLHGTVAAPGLAGTASVLPETTLNDLLQHHSPRMQKGGMPLTNFSRGDRGALISFIRSLPSDAASLNTDRVNPGVSSRK